MTLDLTIFNGTGDGAVDGISTFKGSSSNTVGQILASDTTPISIFQSELQGLESTTGIVLQANGNITSQSNLTAINFATLAGDGGGNIETQKPIALR